MMAIMLATQPVEDVEKEAKKAALIGVKTDAEASPGFCRRCQSHFAAKLVDAADGDRERNGLKSANRHPKNDHNCRRELTGVFTTKSRSGGSVARRGIVSSWRRARDAQCLSASGFMIIAAAVADGRRAADGGGRR